VFEGRAVPPVLLSGDHADIRRWRLEQAVARTAERRPELLANAPLAPEARRALDEFLAAGAAGSEDRGD
jgi:tRNA (guanine37-N1)-methyltransferase